MCEFRYTPVGSFDPVHHGNGDAAPDCVIRVMVQSLVGDCDEEIRLVIVDRDSGRELTKPCGITSDGQERTCDLPMKVATRGLEYRKVVMRYRCCDQEKEGAEDNIWVRCARPDEEAECECRDA